LTSLRYYIALYIYFINITLDLYRNSENFVKHDVRDLIDFDGGLNSAKRRVAAVKVYRFSAFNGANAALTKEM